jgi:toxin ParE1/3/4|tara:strand:+ start:393 stop:758 length:366 start_codon:yes stop_codon:yes gene_type:complete
MTDGAKWQVRLSAAAETDFQNIVRWTSEHFGEGQAHAYADTLSLAIEALTDGPRIIGAKERDEIAKGIFTLHVARGGRKGRHFVMYRVEAPTEPPVVDVLRLLHDSMDFTRHLPSPENGNA